jgi:glucokinase
MDVGVGIDMGGTTIKIGLVKHSQIIAAAKIPASSHTTLSQRLNELADGVDSLLKEHSCTPAGIGIAFPGIVNSDEKRILSKYVKYPDAQKINISSWTTERWGVPFAFENDARAALLGEWQYGAGRGCDNLVLITLGTGVGTAVLINGKMLKGKNYLAGSLGGHVSINLHGDECNCGGIGCVESEASTWALQKNITRSSKFNTSALSREEEINFNTVFMWAGKGDELALEVKENCQRAWTTGIINLIVSYDPERVVIGGGVMNSKDVIIPYVKNMIKKNIWIKDNHIEIVPSEQLEYAGVLGMSYLLTLSGNEYKSVI